jgi:pimeloyl-ACP methyl ester carboxylesterase
MDEPETMELSDGRTLSYAEYGDPDGIPVFCFHGVIGSRLMWSLADEPAAEQGIRVVAPDRPGFGASAFQRGRRLLDWPADVCALADRLGIDRFGVAGFSGGGPHALACAHEVPQRVRQVALASTVTPPWTRDRADPFNEAILSATRFVPGFSRAAFASSSWLAANNWPAFERALVGGSPAADQELFEGPNGDVLFADGAEAFSQGSQGPAHDLPMVGNDWGFDASAVEPPVRLWHGRADETVGLALAQAFADSLPDPDLYITDDAHYSTLVNNLGAVLDGAAAT